MSAEQPSPIRKRTPKQEAVLIVYAGKFKRRSQKWRWKLQHSNGEMLAVSSEGYANRETATTIGKRVCSGGYRVIVES